jgi:Arc/MetJ-type ribon-helix-helix transcriptional regulator
MNTYAASDSEVVRQALLAYEQLVEDVLADKQLVIRDSTGNEVVVPTSLDIDADLGESKSAIKRNLVLPIALSNRLDEIRRHTGAKSDSEVVRNAIAVYDILVRSILDEKEIILISNDRGQRREQKQVIRVAAARPVFNRTINIVGGLRIVSS